MGSSDGKAGKLMWRSWSLPLANDGQFIGNTHTGFIALHTDRGAPRILPAAKALRSAGIAVWQVDGTLWSPEQRSLL